MKVGSEDKKIQSFHVMVKTNAQIVLHNMDNFMDLWEGKYSVWFIQSRSFSQPSPKRPTVFCKSNSILGEREYSKLLGNFGHSSEMRLSWDSKCHYCPQVRTEAYGAQVMTQVLLWISINLGPVDSQPTLWLFSQFQDAYLTYIFSRTGRIPTLVNWLVQWRLIGYKKWSGDH